ncbi:MAG: hypothetical protein OZ929_02090 [Bryobacterales bacterium]|nr:hypothetical protein [Bryobacterales bacterium]
MQEQDADQWCWAAVSVSLEHYFFPISTTSQCQMAQDVLGAADCCSDREVCNQPRKLQEALDVIRRKTAKLPRRLTFQTLPQPLGFPDIRREIDAGFPVCARIGWAGGGGHFVVVSGYRQSPSGDSKVDVADSLFGESTTDFDEFLSAYRDSGQWTATFLVRVQKG